VGRDAFAELKFYDSEVNWRIGYGVPPSGAAQRDHWAGHPRGNAWDSTKITVQASGFPLPSQS